MKIYVLLFFVICFLFLSNSTFPNKCSLNFQQQVLRSGSGKKYGNKKDQLSPLGPAKPVPPPSPDLSGLTHEEATILRDVLKRQEEFENEEINRKE